MLIRSSKTSHLRNSAVEAVFFGRGIGLHFFFTFFLCQVNDKVRIGLVFRSHFQMLAEERHIVDRVVV